jgi:predicted Rossmann fold flavoprotein
MAQDRHKKLIIVGGGAAGFFTAIRAAEVAKQNKIKVDITILEASDSLLKKVRISGGGRCNVTHNIFEVRKFTGNYPRGEKELLSPMQRFQAQDTVEWFRQRGVATKAEADGRMFPVTDSSQTIIDCFMSEIERLGVNINIQNSVQGIRRIVSVDQGGMAPAGSDPYFEILLKDEKITADCVMIATGSGQIGYRLARELGHTITELAPSLFSFKIVHPLLTDLPGLSFEDAHLKLVIPVPETSEADKKSREKVFTQRGPILITHWGLSGPALLKISAWAAREMMHSDYKAQLIVNFLGHKNIETTSEFLKNLKNQNIKAQLGSVTPTGLTKRFWLKMLEVLKIPDDKRWADLSGKELTKLAESLFSFSFDVLGKNRYKDEFVECGGVDLREINFKTMESKICPGLFFAGEVLDIDGITGGFNFQNAWTGGFIAGESMTLWKS